MQEHVERLARIAAGWCDDRADAADLVQDTLERAMRRGIPADVRSPLAYLVAIMRNLLHDRRRALARRPSCEPLEEIVAPVDDPLPAWASLDLDDVRAALAELPPAFRDVFVLHALEHKSYDELAARFAIPRVTVGTRLTRARKRLRAALQKRSETVPA